MQSLRPILTIDRGVFRVVTRRYPTDHEEKREFRKKKEETVMKAFQWIVVLGLCISLFGCQREWSEPTPWQCPIEDYIDYVVDEMGLLPDEFDHSVKELAVYEDRLYFGYGDWTYNTGPVDVRYFGAPEGEWTAEFTVDEESIDYYRTLDGNFFIPGVDATEDALIGNVYFKDPAGEWGKVRELGYALHVLDVVSFDGVLYASGGGCIDMDHYYAGEDEAVIWESVDGGYTWEPVLELMTTSVLDVARWERFLVNGDSLYAFGEIITYTPTGAYFENIHYVLNEGEWSEAGLLSNVLTLHTDPFGPDTGILTGVYFSTFTAQYRAYALESGSPRTLTVFSGADEKVVDVAPVCDAEALFLTRDGDAFPDSAEPPYTYHVYQTSDLYTFEEWLTFTSDEIVMSLAYWKGGLYFGTWDGCILRSTQ